MDQQMGSFKDKWAESPDSKFESLTKKIASGEDLNPEDLLSSEISRDDLVKLLDLLAKNSQELRKFKILYNMDGVELSEFFNRFITTPK